MKAKFKSLKWVKGEAYVRQKVKHGYEPWNAIRGGNGSFVCRKPAALMLRVVDSKNNIREYNIIKLVRGCNNWQNLSEKRVRKIEERLMQENTFEIDKNTGYIKWLEKIVKI